MKGAFFLRADTNRISVNWATHYYVHIYKSIYQFVFNPFSIAFNIFSIVFNPYSIASNLFSFVSNRYVINHWTYSLACMHVMANAIDRSWQLVIVCVCRFISCKRHIPFAPTTFLSMHCAKNNWFQISSWIPFENMEDYKAKLVWWVSIQFTIMRDGHNDNTM